jgi:Fic family protein
VTGIVKRDLAELSANLFGNRYRIVVAAAISELGPGAAFSAKSIAESTGVFYARVQEDLKRLERAGLLGKQPTGGRTVEYVAAQTQYWAMCRLVGGELS